MVDILMFIFPVFDISLTLFSIKILYRNLFLPETLEKHKGA